ncbi:MAG TPA: LON peptidase substrate-binding domain-containing protein [Candidatus Limnocylindrales bacterium]|nr:LON peptidase substrate-binding domain-containing protein [Candidatus Limnocylindrales bacterium]
MTDPGAPRRLPLFVLRSVLYPGAQMPLHIFEPRYRRLVARCLETDGRFGLIHHDPDASGPFLIDEGRVGCVARIVEFKPIPDGRSLLLVEGEDRFAIRDGIESEEPFYEALVAGYEDEPHAAERLRARRAASIRLFRDIAPRALDPSAILPGFDPEVETSFPLAERIHLEMGWRQALLESRSEFDRLDRIDAVLRAVLSRYE